MASLFYFETVFISFRLKLFFYLTGLPHYIIIDVRRQFDRSHSIPQQSNEFFYAVGPCQLIPVRKRNCWWIIFLWNMVISVKGPFFLKSKISTAFTLPPFFNVVSFVLNKTPKFERRNLPAKIKLCFLSSGNHNFFITVLDVYKAVVTLALGCKLYVIKWWTSGL